MYPKLTWIDKCSILEFANKSKAPYILKAFNKVVVDLLETSYETLVREMTINQITTIIANL